MIDLTGVGKEYRSGWPRTHRRVRALDDVTLSVERGSSLGLVGLNGAGKSTLIRLLLGYGRPTDGEVRIAGLPPRQYAERWGVAYVPERVAIPGRWTVRTALRAYAMFSDLGEDAWERVDGVIDRLGLATLAGQKVRTLSKGNVQRVGIAQALLAPRKLMVLDEPTDGLDPVWIAQLREIVAEWRAADAERVLILASHNLGEIERLSDRVLLLHNGRVAHEFAGTEARPGLEPRLLETLSRLEEARA
jgi:ABC-2 type transport system ATP-binding protein